jgi:hypothetical protein
MRTAAVLGKSLNGSILTVGKACVSETTHPATKYRIKVAALGWEQCGLAQLNSPVGILVVARVK